jgi:putative phage-type endonuclease
MTATRIPFTSREQWLTERAKDVTSTEIAALYGLSPYATAFELWHQKRDGYVEAIEPNERIKWGTRLQDAIAAGVAEDRGWEPRRFDDYIRDENDRIGSSFDFEVVCKERGPGLMEIKNVDRSVFYEKWIDDPGGIEGPQHIELQVQHQMEVSGLPWCALVALVGGNDARIAIRERDHAIGRDIRKHVREFWESVEANEPPTPDYEQDAEFLCRLHGRADPKLAIDATPEVEHLLREYADLAGAEPRRKAIKAHVLDLIGTAAKVRTSFGTLSCTETKASEGTLITPDMVGQRVGARRGFRQFRFNVKK